MCCSYIVLTNAHMKPRIQFIIMKIFMKIVENLSKVTPIYGTKNFKACIKLCSKGIKPKGFT